MNYSTGVTLFFKGHAMRYTCVAILFLLTGCSVMEGLLQEPQVLVPIVEKAAVAIAAPSIVTISDVAIAVVAAIAGAAGLKCAHKVKEGKVHA